MAYETQLDEGRYDDLLYEVAAGVARITINRPERRNALSWALVAELRRAFAAAKADPQVRVCVLAGSGDRAFCAGADLSEMTADPEAGRGFLDLHTARGQLAGLLRDLYELGKPTIARVQGFALAGGFGLALTCDLVVASEAAVFGVPEVNVGLWPHLITVPLIRSMPPKVALELMLTGRRVDAAEARQIGFVTQVVAPSELDAAVDALAGTLAAKSPAALRLGRDAFYAVWDQDVDTSLRLLHPMLSVTAATEDAAEGVAAFNEKRDPTWKGR